VKKMYTRLMNRSCGRKTIIVLGVLILILFLSGFSESSYIYAINPGLKYLSNYSPEDYILQPQNWGIVQDRSGIIYIANSGGILEYDGISWHTIEIPNLAVRSLAINESGTIYVGGVNEVGFLAPNANGRMEYRSLIDKLEKSKRNFGKAYRMHITKDGFFFRTGKYLFEWNSKKEEMKTLLEAQGIKKKINTFNASFACEETFFINQKNIGLRHLLNNRFQFISNYKTFSSAQTIFLVVPYNTSNQEYLIGTRELGFFIYDGTSVKPFASEVDSYLKNNNANFGIKLKKSPGDIAITTLKGGLVIIDFQGRIKHIFNKDSGLMDNKIYYVFEDVQGNLWLAMNKGIAKIEYLSPLSTYSEQFGLPGIVLSVTRHNSGLYAGTTEGLFRMGEKESKFTAISRIDGMCFALLSTKTLLLAATSGGLFQIDKEKILSITDEDSFALVESKKNPNRVWAGMGDSLQSLYLGKNNGYKWQMEFRFKKADREIRSIIEDSEGDLWLGPRGRGILKIHFDNHNSIQNYRVKIFDENHHLPGGEVNVSWAANHVTFGADDGLFRFDENNQKFVPDITFGKEFSTKSLYFFRLTEDQTGKVLFHVGGRNYCAIPRPDHSYHVIKKPLSRIPLGAQVNAIYPDPDKITSWLATHHGLIRFNHSIEKDYQIPYNTIIRKVSINGTPEFYNQSSTGTTNSRGIFPQLEYEKRNIRFEFAAPFFEGEKWTKYYHILEGYDKKWSDWNQTAYKSYTNLGVGTYRFRVQAQNVYGEISNEAFFKFNIQPPWFGTWWAYAIYLLLIIMIIFITFRWRSKEIKQRKLELEIKNRAIEIDQKNKQLEKQTLLLIQQSEKLKEMDHAKTRFFANISHEFRTPLTLIAGPLESILDKKPPKRIKEKLVMMQRNSHRLLKLINRLLDISRLDSGKMKLQAVQKDILPFLKGIISSFEQILKTNEIDFQFQTSTEKMFLYFDSEKLEGVFGNILSNSVKFTPVGGKITVSVTQDLKEDDDFPNGSLVVSFRDTGIGIPKEQLRHIFDRFFQVDTRKQKHKGSGIGLALTRELVLLHHGKIDVNSREGEESRSEFIIHLPLGDAVFSTGEITGLQDESGNTTASIDPHSKDFVILEEYQAPDETGGTNDVKESHSQKEPGDKQGKRHKKTILVVDDEKDMRKYIDDAIASQYKVIEAENGKIGIEKAIKTMPDLIISDIMMPEVNGYELCQTLKTKFETSHIPIIMLTAKASEDSKLQGLDTGADEYIAKPFHMKELITRIKNLIRLRKKLQEKFQQPIVLDPDDIDVSSIDQSFLKHLHEIIETNLEYSDLNVESLSEKMDISRVTLNRKIHSLTGETANEFIRSYRLKRAVQLLEANFGNITAVALEVGFSSSAYFTKCFKSQFKKLPSEYLTKS
jgi:signal transduction histidine kinase/DNA-binding response OmpR family regulator